MSENDINLDNEQTNVITNMAINNNFSKTLLENEIINNKKLNLENVIVDLDSSNDSDIEIIGVSKNLANGKRKHKYKNTIQNRERTKVYVNSVDCSNKNQQESYIKEEIIISDATDSSDDDGKKKPESTKSQNASIKCNLKRKINNQNDSLSSIIRNCPRCNKTETVFSTTIKCICKECNINMSYVCNKCNYRYDSMLALYRHKKLQCQSALKAPKKSSPLKFFILKCAKCSLTQKIHNMKGQKRCRKCKIDMVYECMICSKTYTSYSGTYVHTKLKCQPSIKMYYCNNCTYKCSAQDALQRHLILKHPELYPTKLSCLKCGRTFNNHISLKSHTLRCGVSCYPCKFCSYNPKTLETLAKHLTLFHRDRVQPEDFDNILMKISKNNERNKGDETKSLDDKIEDTFDLKQLRNIYCPKCEKSWPFAKGQYLCTYCNSIYLYECQRCNKKFKRSSLLYRHIRRQHGKLIHACNNCNRTFSFYGDANEHRKRCGTEPRYECEICFFKTRYKYNLRCHINKLHGGNRRSFTCGTCGIEYKTSKSIMRHLNLGCQLKSTT